MSVVPLLLSNPALPRDVLATMATNDRQFIDGPGLWQRDLV